VRPASCGRAQRFIERACEPTVASAPADGRCSGGSSGAGNNNDGVEDTIDGNNGSDSDTCYYVSGQDTISDCESPQAGNDCYCG